MEKETIKRRVHNCSHCLKQGRALFKCTQCRVVRYCSNECQTLAWENHQKNCIDSNADDTVEKLQLKAANFSDQGDYEKAEKLLRRALDLESGKYGDKHENTLNAFLNLANTFGYQGKFSEAEELYRKCVVGVNETKLKVQAMASLGSVCGQQGRYDEAESILIAAIESSKKVHGEDDSDTLDIMHNLGNTFQIQNKYEEAAKQFEICFEKQKRVLGFSHSSTLLTMRCLASTYSEQGKIKEAEVLHRLALEKRKVLHGQGHPLTLASMNNLALFYAKNRLYEKAVVVYRELLEKYKQVKHPEAIEAVFHLADLLFGKFSAIFSGVSDPSAEAISHQGEIDESITLYKKYLKKSKDIHESRRMMIFERLRKLYYLQKRFDEAEIVQRQMLERQKMTLGEMNPQTLLTMFSLANTHIYQKRYEDAKDLYEKCLTNQKVVRGLHHPETIQTINALEFVNNNLNNDDVNDDNQENE